MSKPYWIAGIPIYSECTRIAFIEGERQAVLKLATPANRMESGTTKTYYSDSYTLSEARECLIDLMRARFDDRETETARKALIKVFEGAYQRLGGSLDDLPQIGRNGFNTPAQAQPTATAARKPRKAPAEVVVAANAGGKRAARSRRAPV
ncbi:MAG: hypothetical protein EBQ96_01740 [Proteobacteria bacterium]|nr:hypothetical protein [Pseudomonadota bacterium]